MKGWFLKSRGRLLYRKVKSWSLGEKSPFSSSAQILTFFQNICQSLYLIFTCAITNVLEYFNYKAFSLSNDLSNFLVLKWIILSIRLAFWGKLCQGKVNWFCLNFQQKVIERWHKQRLASIEFVKIWYNNALKT